MMNTSKKPDFNIQPGEVIQGKWHRRSYKIIKQLGYGATGVVYLAQYNRKFVALKLSENCMAITSEVNVLKSLSQVQGSSLGPSLLDVDDWVVPGKRETTPFYVMEYVKGRELLEFIQLRGSEWIVVLTIQLLSELDKLHKTGWVFGDLKPDNLLVSGPPPCIRWFDVGGTTRIGRSIKEYTEYYDRGYWGLGTRKAEPSYDLFAVAMIFIELAYGSQCKKDGQGILQLEERIRRHPFLTKYRHVLIRALEGKYRSAEEMKAELMKPLNQLSARTTRKPPEKKATKAKKPPTTMAQTTVVTRKSKGIYETAFITILLFAFYFLYLYFQNPIQ
ncbi:protein kinase family protein [Bacillus tianshenii]|nr:protein kinase family protein [Bacillus tianshenii]